MDGHKPGLHQGCHAADAVQHVIVGGDHQILAVPSDGLDERCGGRVNHHGLNVIALGQAFQLCIVLFVRALHTFSAAVEIAFLDAQGLAVMNDPQAHAAGVVRAVVDGHIELTVDVGSVAVEEVGVLPGGEEGIHKALGSFSLAENVTSVPDRAAVVGCKHSPELVVRDAHVISNGEMPVIITVFRVLALLLFVQIQDIFIVPVTLCLGVQVVKYLSVRAGQGTVEYFLDESFAAFIGFGDVRGTVGIALDKLFITGFATTRHQHHLFAGGSLDVQTVAVLVGALTAAALKVIFQAKAVTVQNVQPGGRSRHTRNEVYSAGMLFQNGAIRHRNKHVLAATFAALCNVEPVVEAVPEETHLVL